MTLLALVVLAAFALYVMKPAEREVLLRRIVDLLRKVAAAAARRTSKRDPFDDALHARTKHVVIVPGLVTANILVFVAMLLGPGSLSDPETLIQWGANFGPRTTNAEWGRTLESLFIHAGPLHLLATVAGLVQAGLIMERLAGYLTLAAVYLIAGFLASIVSLWLYPLDVSFGPSAAVFGIYGFLAATSLRGMRSSNGVVIPVETLKALAPAAALFVLYNTLAGGLRLEAEVTGLVTGFGSGLVLAAQLGERKPAARLVLKAAGATFMLAAALAVPVRGITDVRPEIEWIVRLETGTASRYETALERFRRGIISAKDLAGVIEKSIVPEIESARARLIALGGVPREHRALIARAGQFLEQRDKCWRLRAEALAQGNMAVLREADRIEVTSMATLEQIKPEVRQ